MRGFCQLGRFHQIEVEDNVTAYLEWANGATGVFVSSTGEAPGTTGSRSSAPGARLVMENNQHRVHAQRGGHDRVQPDREAGFRETGRVERGDPV